MRCKACNMVLGETSADLELCQECLEVVYEYNKDLLSDDLLLEEGEEE